MGDQPKRKPVRFVGSARSDLRAFPREVKLVFASALSAAQLGGKHRDSKVLKGFGGANVLEIADDHDGDTYRGVYTVRFASIIYVLHAFQKKSKRGSETSKRDMDLIRQRLKSAEQDYKSEHK
ncbi:MAG: type II toxin-antitoxin system RelE/ParE family toxin [Candidatus Binatus sp.]|uniref:type II toxin-antitoxin system RelE/ParE family toxin n=1 Tax=Candidatus Binatus sp. TaxID=2811406 RepID=UPI00271CDA83|nr:type II toxin-antitoxin system RelE/ParE family toxin [Candidatus Binatus sp.]MDO8433163.1 type II toxin-antitoxin system RelE/ParE family toxin [Candidatus Binatus sp.]